MAQMELTMLNSELDLPNTTFAVVNWTQVGLCYTMSYWISHVQWYSERLSL